MSPEEAVNRATERGKFTQRDVRQLLKHQRFVNITYTDPKNVTTRIATFEDYLKSGPDVQIKLTPAGKRLHAAIHSL